MRNIVKIEIFGHACVLSNYLESTLVFFKLMILIQTSVYNSASSITPEDCPHVWEWSVISLRTYQRICVCLFSMCTFTCTLIICTKPLFFPLTIPYTSTANIFVFIFQPILPMVSLINYSFQEQI